LLVGGTLIGQRVIASLLDGKVAQTVCAASADEVRIDDIWQETDLVMIDRATIDDDASNALLEKVGRYRPWLSVIVLLRDGETSELGGVDYVIERPLTSSRLLAVLAGIVEGGEGRHRMQMQTVS
jgi:hypothetical protein